MNQEPTKESPIRAGELSKEPTLLKLASHLRWLVEKSGVDPEKCVFAIGAPDVLSKNRIMAQIQHEFSGGMMRYLTPSLVEIIGCKISVHDTKPHPPKEAA